MAISFVGESSEFGGSGDTNIIYSPIIGNALILFIGQYGGAPRNYTITDNIDGDTGWIQRVRLQTSGNQVIEIWTKHNIPAGITSISINQSGSAVTYRAIICEFSGFVTTLNQNAIGSLEELSNSDNHACNAAPISLVTNGICVCAGVLNVAVTSTLPGPEFTRAPNGGTHNQSLFQWRIANSGFSSDGPWESVGIDREGKSVMAMLGGPIDPDSLPFFTQLGAIWQ